MQIIKSNLEEKLRTLRDNSYFTSLREPILVEIAQGMRLCRFKRGEIIFWEADECAGLHMIRSGSVKLFKVSPHGRELIVKVLEGGATFNEVAVFDNGTNPINVAALEDCEIWVIEAGRLQDCLYRYPEMAQSVILNLGKNLRNLLKIVEAWRRGLGGRKVTKTRKRWLIAAGLAVIVAAAGVVAVQGGALQLGAKAEQKKKEQTPLAFAATDIVRLAPQRLFVELSMPGTVEAFNQATVRSKLSAEVIRLPVREGDRVAAGQVIAEFDTAQLRNQLAERQATLESARATLAQTERTRASNAQLVQQSFISKNAFDTADDAPSRR